MLTFRFMAFINFLLDILYDTSQLCRLFQKSEVSFDEAFTQLDLILSEIKANYIDTANFGENYKKFHKDFEQELYFPEFLIFYITRM